MIERGYTAHPKEKEQPRAHRRSGRARLRENLNGYIFVLPYVIGLIVFFAFPLVFSLRISFGQYQLSRGGYTITPTGLENYYQALFEEVDFTQVFIGTMTDTLVDTPLIVVFSLILAVMLNRKLPCKGIFRTIFFLPFLLGSGYVMKQLLGMNIGESAMSMARGIIFPQEVQEYIGPVATKIAMGFLSRITLILWRSGVPIVLFLSGLQSIPVSLYEASMVDGATEWEKFWKVTVPMISPVMLLVMVYTVIDSFTDASNGMVDLFYQRAFERLDYSMSAAMSWLYFAFILVVVLLIFLFMRRFIYSEHDTKA